MTKTSASGQKPRDVDELDNTQAPSILKTLQNHQDHHFSQELCSLSMMYKLLESYRKDFLAARKEFKQLREVHSTNQLASMHVQHKLDLLDERTRKCASSYNDLRNDYQIQRSGIIKQTMLRQPKN